MAPDMEERAHGGRRHRARWPSPWIDGPVPLAALRPAPEPLVARVLELPLLDDALTRLGHGHDAHELDPPALRAALRAVGLDPDDARLRMLMRLRSLRAGIGVSDGKSPERPPDMR